MNKTYPKELKTLIAFLKRLPGVGSKTAERFAFELLKWPEGDLTKISQSLDKLNQTLYSCKDCGALQDNEGCLFCFKTDRDTSTLCIVEGQREVYTIEETHLYKGLYHVIGHLISPLDDKLAEDIDIETLIKRIEKTKVQEVILAFDASLEGDATALYLKEKLQKMDLKITRLAFGIPMGSSLDYVDGGTLGRALKGRQFF